MAISEETAALVAAQLTAAWAAHGIERTQISAAPAEQVFRQYQHFKKLVSEREPREPMRVLPLAGA